MASVPPTRRIELSVEGMTCAACSGAVERALRNAHSGVLDVQASAVRCFSTLFEVHPHSLRTQGGQQGFAQILLGGTAVVSLPETNSKSPWK